MEVIDGFSCHLSFIILHVVVDSNCNKTVWKIVKRNKGTIKLMVLGMEQKFSL